MRYAYVVEGVVLEGPRLLPVSWRNISNLPALDDARLKALGWLPWRLVETQGEVIVGSTVEVFSDEVVETQIRRAKTDAEYAAEREQAAESVRQERNQRLAECDWTQLSDAPVDRDAWAAYRQALRDVPSQEGFPAAVEWPVPPG